MVRLLRPTADITVDGWTRNDGSATNLYQAIDEASASETDYIRSDGSQNPATYTASFTGGSEIGTNSGVTIRVREMKDSAGTETTDLDVIVSTPTGWQVHTESYDDIDQTINAVEFTLTTDEVAELRANGGDFADMRVSVVRRKRQTITTTTGITYASSPTRLVDIRYPATGGPYPIVVCVVDGGWQANGFPTAAPSAIRLAQEEGFVAATIGLRTAPTYTAPAPMQDCALLIDYLVTNAATYNADASKIAFIGGSGGGHVSTFAAFGTYLTSGQFARVQCVAACSPPTALRLMDDDLCDSSSTADIVAFTGTTEAAGAATWDTYSPIYRVASDTKPILLAYSVSDAVTPAQGNRLATVLASNSVPYRNLLYAGSDHGWTLIADAAPWAEIVTWLHRYLG